MLIELNWLRTASSGTPFVVTVMIVQVTTGISPSVASPQIAKEHTHNVVTLFQKDGLNDI
jgi:hypothetical protein